MANGPRTHKHRQALGGENSGDPLDHSKTPLDNCLESSSDIIFGKEKRVLFIAPKVDYNLEQ